MTDEEIDRVIQSREKNEIEKSIDDFAQA